MSYKLLCRVFSSNPLNLSKKPPDAFAQDFVSLTKFTPRENGWRDLFFIREEKRTRTSVGSYWRSKLEDTTHVDKITGTSLLIRTTLTASNLTYLNLIHHHPAMPCGNWKKYFRAGPLCSVLSDLKKYHPPWNLKFNNVGIFQSLKLRNLLGKILRISFKQNFTQILWAVMGAVMC